MVLNEFSTGWSAVTHGRAEKACVKLCQEGDVVSVLNRISVCQFENETGITVKRLVWLFWVSNVQVTHCHFQKVVPITYSNPLPSQFFFSPFFYLWFEIDCNQGLQEVLQAHINPDNQLTTLHGIYQNWNKEKKNTYFRGSWSWRV